MKKQLFILAVAILGLTCRSYGQATVSFANSSGTAISNSLTSARATAGTTFSIAVYYLPDRAGAPVTGDFDSARAIVLTTNGLPSINLFGPGVFQAPGGYGIAPNLSGAATGWFQVRAWESAYGTTYEAALANTTQVVAGRLALVGTSDPIRMGTGNGAVVPPTVPPTTMVLSGLKSFYLVPVPEPSVIGLGLLGVGALLLLRRRSK